MKIKLGLLPRVAIAIVLGLALGSFFPTGAVRGVATVTAFIDQLIKFMVPLIILGLVTPAIAEAGRAAGRLLLMTVALAYCSTLIAGFLGFGVSSLVFPSLVSADGLKAIAQESVDFAPFVTIEIPQILSVMSALVFSFIVGLGMVFTSSDYLKRTFTEFRDIIVLTINRVIVPLLPVYIFGVFLAMTAEGKTGKVLVAFGAIIAVFSLLTLVVILLQFLVAGAIARKNPFKAIATMLPAYMTALGTSSSAATIPVTRAQTVANGVSPEIADFTIPLCATVHLAGSTIKLVCCAVALLLMSGRPEVVNLGTFSFFIFIVGIVMIAAPGVPGGAVMSALGILESVLGFGQSELALIITIYIATDSIGTACNITGDGAIALIVDRFSRRGAK